MTFNVRRLAASAIAGGLVLTAGAALAAQPVPGGIDLQPAASPIMHEIRWFHSAILMPIITAVVLFVLALLVYVVVKFNAKANPTPSKTTHNVTLEVAWTVVPVLILVVIAIPSFQLLYREQTIPPSDITVKATGVTWAWSYTYPDHGNIEFRSTMLREEGNARVQAARAMNRPVEQMPRLLAVDNEMVVPVGKVIRVQVTAADVMHSFAVPALGVKVDAIPGRLNETWFRAERPGLYYGQCSELCGRDHAFMPIAVRVVSEQEFAAWVEEAKRRFASAPAPTTIASLEAAQ